MIDRQAAADALYDWFRETMHGDGMISYNGGASRVVDAALADAPTMEVTQEDIDGNAVLWADDLSGLVSPGIYLVVRVGGDTP